MRRQPFVKAVFHTSGRNAWSSTVGLRKACSHIPDVRREVEQRGFCLIRRECSFDRLAAEIRGGETSSDEDVSREPSPDGPPAAYHFFVHQTRPAWRLALGSRSDAPAVLTAWRFSRTRTPEATASTVRAEVAARGYSLFKIGEEPSQLSAAIAAGRRSRA